MDMKHGALKSNCTGTQMFMLKKKPTLKKAASHFAHKQATTPRAKHRP